MNSLDVDIIGWVKSFHKENFSKFSVQLSFYSHRLIQTMTISEFAGTFFEGINPAYHLNSPSVNWSCAQ